MSDCHSPETPVKSTSSQYNSSNISDNNLLLDLEQMAAILDFSPTMQCLKYFLTTPQCPVYLKTPR